MKKVIFVDRDGTILREPDDEQIDSLEKAHFIPGAISGLRALMGIGYELVIASNQDGLGTDAYPMETYLPAHNWMLETLAGEGVHFDNELIDRTFPEDNAPTRKPGTGMFTQYMNGDYDLSASYVIGDRATDMQLAANLGCTGIRISDTETWADAVRRIRMGARYAEIHRATAETDILVQVALDKELVDSRISTGLGFLDHMLTQLIHHGGLGLRVEAKGDLQVDEHHTVEDIAIALGEALRKALGNKAGINRYGFALPMDECEALVLMDLGGRIDFEWDAVFTREMVGDVPTEMWRHFFQSLCSAMQCNLHISAKSAVANYQNDHHLIEGIFKAFARTLRQAVNNQGLSYDIPSSKGIL